MARNCLSALVKLHWVICVRAKNGSALLEPRSFRLFDINSGEVTYTVAIQAVAKAGARLSEWAWGA